MSSEQITAISSLVVACIALFISIWQGWVTRKHNRLSVRPFLRIDKSLQSDHPVEISIRNSGVGPLFIVSFDILLDNNVVMGDSGKKLKIIKTKLGIQDLHIRFYHLLEGEAISPGEVNTLFKVESIIDKNHNLLNILSRLTYKIKYKSIYNEVFEICR